MNRFFGAATFFAAFAGVALAQNSAVGNWQYVDGTKTTYITTTEEGGQLKAKITKVAKDGKDDPSAACAKCSGDSKDKPMAGLLILWDTKKDGDNWKDGKLLDPDSGRVVNGKVEIIEGGKKLNVRGNVAFISKTQVWSRMP
ncbi:MAG: DUF2147 domain-containing protein [Bryobacteraceae bacterium]